MSLGIQKHKQLVLKINKNIFFIIFRNFIVLFPFKIFEYFFRFQIRLSFVLLPLFLLFIMHFTYYFINVVSLLNKCF